MTKQKKMIPLVLVAALATTPFLTEIPKAYAIEDLYIEAEDDGADEESVYNITFDLESKLKKGDYIEVRFHKDYDISDVTKSDVFVDGERASAVSISGRTLSIKSPVDFKSGATVEIEIEAGITNPDSSGTYKVEVKAGDDAWESYNVKIKGSSSSGSSSKKGAYDVTVSGKYTGDKTKIELEKFRPDTKLTSGKKIYVTFPSKDMLPSKIYAEDVLINDEEAKSVVVSGKEVTIEIPKAVDGDRDLEIEFLSSAGITLPESSGNYSFEVEYQSETYTSSKFEVKKGTGSSSSGTTNGNYAVSLSNSDPGARSSYTFTVDLGKTKLYSGNNIEIEFPSADMIPPVLSANSITLNGDKVASATSYGGRVYLKVPPGFKADSTIKVVFSEDAWITNPKMPGSDYVLVAHMAGEKVKSDKFTIGSGGTVTTPGTGTVTTPVAVNNSTATIALTKSALNTPTGLNIGIKGLGVPLVKDRDFLEIVLPLGFRVPTFVNVAAVSVNGVQPSFVATRGQNLIIYPGQNIPAGTAVNVVVSESAGIATPQVKNVYSIGVYSSAEKYLLFARPVSIGGAPLPAVQPQPQTPAPLPNVPASAARLKMDVASFTLNGKSYPLSAAPYTLNGNTLVPAQFYREALNLSTVWSNQVVQISSGTTVIKFTVGSNVAKVGKTDVALPVAVQMKNGMPMVPFKMIAETFKYKYGWDDATKSVYIYK